MIRSTRSLALELIQDSTEDSLLCIGSNWLTRVPNSHTHRPDVPGGDYGTLHDFHDEDVNGFAVASALNPEEEIFGGASFSRSRSRYPYA